jgi:hypothetical protein
VTLDDLDEKRFLFTISFISSIEIEGGKNKRLYSQILAFDIDPTVQIWAAFDECIPFGKRD